MYTVTAVPMGIALIIISGIAIIMAIIDFFISLTRMHYPSMVGSILLLILNASFLALSVLMVELKLSFSVGSGWYMIVAGVLSALISLAMVIGYFSNKAVVGGTLSTILIALALSVFIMGCISVSNSSYVTPASYMRAEKIDNQYIIEPYSPIISEIKA